MIRWGRLSDRSKPALEIGWLIVAGLVALQVGFIQPRNRERSVAMEKATGLAAVAGGWEPMSYWRSSSGVAAERSGLARIVMQASLLAPAGGGGGGGGQLEQADSSRKLIHTASLSLIVKSPAEASERIVRLAQSEGGFLVTSQVSGDVDAPAASLTIRVPAAKFERIRTEIRDLSARVESESIEAQDVTKQYVDQEARLRNLRAEEQQYLGILRKATTVKDTLEVSDKLNEIRGAIEERQAEFEALSKQVETVAINVALRAEADTQVFGLHWRPLYQMKISAREGIEGLGSYMASMMAFVFYLPAILLWLFTILAGAAVGWRILKWSARMFFRSSKQSLPDPVRQ